jgi:glycosyltransferase involved in cell wall biosynthesis
MSEQELHSLYVHPKIKALINLGHGEGFGLPLFEAAYSGLPVITHEFGGQSDFLYAPKKDKKADKEKLRPHFSKVKWDLKPVQPETHWKGVIEPDQQWAYPTANSSRLAMREAVKNYGMVKGEAKRLKKWLVKEFAESKKYEQFTKAIYDPSSEELEWLEELSKIRIV